MWQCHNNAQSVLQVINHLMHALVIVITPKKTNMKSFRPFIIPP